jgi:5'/3'-nucleotidase
MKVLLTNDDGIHAPGLWALYKRFAGDHDVTIIAPDHERSAVSHGITLNEPLRATYVEVNNGYKGYAVTGTPADCIKLGVLEILDEKPDIVISGINPGANVGVNINYSGTVAAAKEAALYGITAIAVSIQGTESNNYDDTAFFIEVLSKKVFEKGLPFGTFLNVNMPDVLVKETAGLRFSRQGIELFSEYFEKRIDPRNRTYYWQGCESQFHDISPDVDSTAICNNFISITPIKCDMTDYKMLDDLQNWNIEI